MFDGSCLAFSPVANLFEFFFCDENPRLQKTTKGKKKGDLQRSECFVGTRLNSSSVYLLYTIPRLLYVQGMTVQP